MKKCYLFLLLFLMILLCSCQVSEYKIDFYFNSFSDVKYETRISVKGAKVEAPEELKKKGYLFIGWFDKDNKEFDEYEEFKKDTAFCCKYQLIEYSITYELNDGVNEIDNPSNYDIENKIIFKDPKKEGYEFLGWYFNNTLIKDTEGLTEDLTLIAKWKENSYKINYNLNGGTNNNDNKASYSINDNLIFEEPYRFGYQFLGWYTNDLEINSTKGLLTDLSIEAKWKIIDYTITYNLDGGVNSNLNKDIYNVSQLMTFQVPTKEDYRFLGWYYENQEIKDTNGLATDLSLEAKWEKVIYNITYNLDGGINDVNNKNKYNINEVTTFLNPTKVGYNFLGWYFNNQKIEDTKDANSDLVLSAKWEKIIYNITYNLDGGTNNELNVNSYDVETSYRLYQPIKEGYEFLGWYTNNSEELSLNIFVSLGNTGDCVYNALFKAKSYLLVLIDNDLNKRLKEVEVLFNEPIKEYLDEYKKVGYDFSGWYLDKEYTKDASNELMKVDGLVCYVKNILHQYKVQIKDGNTIVKELNYSILDNDFLINPILKDGYTFNGYFDGVTTLSNYLVKVSELKDIALTTVYTINTVTISFVSNGGSKVEPLSGECFSTVEKPVDPIKENSSFLGWFLDKDCLSEYHFATFPISSITLYAKWSGDQTYLLSFDSNVENVIVTDVNNNSLVLAGRNIQFSIQSYYIKDYAFDGWYVNDNKASVINEFEYIMGKEDTLIYAKFVKIEYYEYQKNQDQDLVINLINSYNALKGCNITSNDYEFNNYTLTISKEYLDKQDEGINDYLCYFEQNKVVSLSLYIYINIIDSDKLEENAFLDYDINYPNVTLLFNENPMNDYYLFINNEEYYNIFNGYIIDDYNKAITNNIRLVCKNNNELKEEYSFSIKGYNSNNIEYYTKSFTYLGNTYDYVIDGYEDLMICVEYLTFVESITNMTKTEEYPNGMCKTYYWIIDSYYNEYISKY